METMLVKVAKLAMKLGRKHLADYGSIKSRHDFTQAQLMGCLILKAYLKTTYRGVWEIIQESPRLRKSLGLTDKLPHFTTIQKFHDRSQVPEIVQAMVATLALGAGAVKGKVKPDNAAMDSTGLSGSTASEYFRTRTGGSCRQWIKISVMIWCTSHLPMAVSIDAGPSNDRKQVRSLLDQAQKVGRPSKLFADAGYDAEWIHQECREQWQVESLIAAKIARADGTRGGHWRSKMDADYLKKRGYKKRWSVETFFSGLKRKVGSTLNSRKTDNQVGEAAWKLLAYAIFR